MSSKNYESLVKEYVRRISDDELNYLNIRYVQNLFGDKAEVAHCLSRDKQIDKLLAAATDAEDWFDIVDYIGEYVNKEHAYRFAAIKN